MIDSSCMIDRSKLFKDTVVNRICHHINREHFKLRLHLTLRNCDLIEFILRNLLFILLVRDISVKVNFKFSIFN